MIKHDLTEALARYEQTWAFQHGKEEKYLDSLFADAARLVERLLPGVCEICKGKGRISHGGTHAEWGPCPACHGSGRVWDEGIVEAVAQIVANAELGVRSVKATITEKDQQTTRAVLSAIAQLAEEET